MKTKATCYLITIAFLFSPFVISAQTTNWKGTTNTNWNNAANWTNGVPNSTLDAVLGDVNFTGGNQPTVNATSTCKSLTVGGTVITTLTLTKNLVVSGNVTINSNATVSHPASTMTLSGNWINNGTYTTSTTTSKIVFAGVSQSISGTSVTNFRRITINTSSTVTLNSNITSGGSGSYIYIYGTLDPSYSPTYTVTSTVLFRIFNNGRIMVNASTFAGNYILSATITFSAGCRVEYSSTTTNQVISSSYTYSTLIISGTGIKSLSANLPLLRSTTSAVGNIFVNSGTLDLVSFTADRGTTVIGGQIDVANGATLKIGGTNTFPLNYNTRVLNLTSSVIYYGANQTVSAQTYGNLSLTGSTGTITKTMPGTSFTVEGSFSSLVGTATSVSYTSAADITFNGSVSIGTSTIFNGNVNTHTVRDHWVNNGTFTGSTSSVNFDGPGIIISGSGLQNFNNINFTSTGITAATGTVINVEGNLSTTGSGEFTHNTGGTLNMTGSSKTITGTSITFNDLNITGSVTTSTSFIINNNFSVAGSFSGSAGTVTMPGASKTISGAGSIAFSSLDVSGSITTASNFSISSLLNIIGAFSASAGTATFTNSSVLSGTANLYNATINGTSLQLSSGSLLGIANLFTISTGTLDVISTSPNTVNYNGTGAQSILAVTYHHLTLSTGNTKTAAGNITVNGNLTIGSSTTFNGATATHTILRNWVNSGTYTASTGTVQFTGVNNATLTGSTTFNILTVNKSASVNTMTLLNDVTAATVNMTNGKILTNSNTLTITTTRTGNGIILGNINRTHSFTTGVAYAFEGPDNTINFSVVSGVTSVTVTVTIASVSDFPDNAAINREYSISVPAGTYTATLRLHYEDAELNGNDETVMTLWNFTGGNWVETGKTSNNTTSNYIEQSGLTNIVYRWTCSETPGVVRWNGSVSNDWNTAANWTTVAGLPNTPPSADDIVRIGTGSFTDNPVISTAVSVKSINFGSVQAATLTIAAGGSLTTNGNISGTWSADAVHTINAGNQNLTVYGSLLLSNGTNNRSINLSVGSGTVALLGNLSQSGNAVVAFTGAGSLNIGGDYSYTSGAFTPGSSTVTYNGIGEQATAAVQYNNIVINKSAGIATLATTTTITGNLTVSSGVFNIDAASVTTSGNITIASGATLDCDGVTLNVEGNWTNSGTYIATSGTVILNGTGAQSISSSTFNNLSINKSSGTATLAGNNLLGGNLSIQSGTFDLGTYTVNRSSTGGSLTLAAGTVLNVSGTNNFPSGYTTQSLNATSLVHYNGVGTQSVTGLTYGGLTFSNGGSNAKTMAANVTVAGDILINSGATFHSGGYTTTLSGNWTNNGTFTPSTGTVLLNGIGKTITGTTTFNNVTVNGTYTVAGSNTTYNGHMQVTGTGYYNAGNGTATLNSDLTNRGTLISDGTTNFTGTSLQTLRLINALTSASTGIVNFNGNVSPVLNSTSSPQFATLNISNTAGINPSISWTVFVAMNVNSGGKFNGGLSTHNIYGSFTNSGTTTSTGRMNFIPVSAKTINFGSTGFNSSGTVNLGGSGQITIAGTPGLFTNVIVSNTNSAGVSPTSNWTIDSNFVVSSTAIFHAGSYIYNVGENIQSDGVLNGGTSTFVLNSADGELTASAQTSFNHITINGTITPQTDFKVMGNFTNNGTYDGSVGVLIMTGSNAAFIGGTTIPCPIAQLTIEKSGGSLVTQNVNLSGLSFLNIFSGILFTSTRTITQDPGGGILVINDGATLRLGGTNSMPGFSGYGLDVNSNVDYAGTTQAIGNAANYGNLLITSAGNKNALVALTVLGNLIVSSGTIATSTVTLTHSIVGNFIMTGSGALSGTNSTYNLNGTNDQTLTLLSSLVRLTIDKTSGTVNLGSNVTTGTALTFTNGKINIGNYDFTMSSGATITGVNLSKYFIAEGSGTVIQQVTAGGSKMYPVGTVSNYMPATVALTAGSTTDNFSVRVKALSYGQGETGAVITSKAVSGTWVINEAVAGGSTATITLQWNTGMELSGFNRTFSRLAKHTGTQWDYGMSDIAAAGSNPYTISRSGFTSFSPFAVGMLDALPVTWLSLSGSNAGNSNIVNWSTTAEWNNNYFAIEASTDGTHFSDIGRVNGAINSTTIQRYSFTHSNINGQIYFYRIRQVDIDNKFSYSATLKITPTSDLVSGMRLYPNPVFQVTKLEFNLAKTGLVSISIHNMAGIAVYSSSGSFQKGKNKFSLDLTNKPAGLYTAQIIDEAGNKELVKFIKN